MPQHRQVAEVVCVVECGRSLLLAERKSEDLHADLLHARGVVGRLQVLRDSAVTVQLGHLGGEQYAIRDHDHQDAGDERCFVDDELSARRSVVPFHGPAQLRDLTAVLDFGFTGFSRSGTRRAAEPAAARADGDLHDHETEATFFFPPSGLTAVDRPESPVESERGERGDAAALPAPLLSRSLRTLSFLSTTAYTARDSKTANAGVQ